MQARCALQRRCRAPLFCPKHGPPPHFRKPKRQLILKVYNFERRIKEKQLNLQLFKDLHNCFQIESILVLKSTLKMPLHKRCYTLIYSPFLLRLRVRFVILFKAFKHNKLTT